MTSQKTPKTDPMRSMMNARRADAPTDTTTLHANPSDDSSLLARFQALQAKYDAQQRLLESLADDASSDASTGLANRRTLDKELERSLATARRYNRRHALMLIEIDGYPALADQFGAVMGTQILQHVARLLRQNIRPTDIAARLHDGQFAVILNELRAIENAEMRAADLSAIIAGTPCIGESRSLHLSVSLGFYVFGADDDAADVHARAHPSRASLNPPQHT